jgi:NAD(P)-dependent dehydrogenase (short-subunit alcohol dehydrogenase family)
MARILITGSSDGLGLMTGRVLAEQRHEVVLHARNEARAQAARAALPQAEAVLVGDVSTLAAIRDVADQANGLGRFDAVIHNVGIGYRETHRVETADGLVYLSSGMHTGGDPSLNDPEWSARRWNGSQAYSDTKLHDVLLAFGVARRWPDVLSNAVTPGWVPTRMGGPGAPDDLDQGPLTQAWLAVSDDPEAQVTGEYFYHLRPAKVHPSARDPELQDRLLDYCRDLSGVALL